MIIEISKMKKIKKYLTGNVKIGIGTLTL